MAAVSCRDVHGTGFHHDDVHHDFALGLVQIVNNLFGQRHLVGAALGDDGVLRVVGEEALDIGHGADGVDDFLQFLRRVHVER